MQTTPIISLLVRERLLMRAHLLLLYLMRKMYLVIRSPLFLPFANVGLNALKVTEFVS